MTEQQARENSWLLLPFYSDPLSPNHEQTVVKFSHFVDEAVGASDLKLAIVDDGSDLQLNRLNIKPDLFVPIPRNKGKAHAIRQGLHALLTDPRDVGFIVQYDSDGDQPPRDIPKVHDRLIEASSGEPENPTLVIGNRYSEGLKTPPNLDSVAYRQTLLIFFGALARQLGADDSVRDWVSGARGYTSSYARGFLERSQADRYGVESEQLILGGLMGARMTTARLTDSRPRDPWTLTNKWLQNFDVYAAHAKELAEQGKGHVVDIVTELVDQLKGGQEFSLDLNPLGEDTAVRLRRWDHERHTAEIPDDYRYRIFEKDSMFPFTLKRANTSPVIALVS